MLSKEKSPQASKSSGTGIATRIRPDNPDTLFQDDALSTAVKKWNPAAFFRLAGQCALFYVVAQVFQQIAYRLMSPGTSLQAEIAARASALDQIRLVLVLLSIFFSVIAFAAIGLRLFRSSPGAALVGFIGCFTFVLCEVLYRGLDLFVVSRNWAIRYGATDSAAVREGIAARIEIWNEGVGGWYFGLLLAFLVGSIGFALAAWNSGERWDKLLAAVFLLNSVRLVLRLAHQFAGVRWLGAINATIYFPIVLIVFGFVSIWLFHQAVRANSG